MALTERIWNALTAIIKLEDKVSRQAEALKAQQMRIESLTERVIRLEAQWEAALRVSAVVAERKGRQLPYKK
jgi:hypothetical protein